MKTKIDISKADTKTELVNAWAGLMQTSESLSKLVNIHKKEYYNENLNVFQYQQLCNILRQMDIVKNEIRKIEESIEA